MLLSDVSAAKDEKSAATHNSQNGVGAKKTLWLIRHGQGEHNVFIDKGIQLDDPEITQIGVQMLDPPLTKLGRRQAEECSQEKILSKALHGDINERVELIVISPLRRTIETGVILLQSSSELNPNVSLIIHPDLQETGVSPCDTGSSIETVKKIASNFSSKVDLSLITSVSHEKKGRYEDTLLAVQKRLNDFVQWLESRQETRILIISHHNAFLQLTGNSFFNCECRSYELISKRFVPLLPKVSTRDEELTERDKRHLHKFEANLRKRMKQKYGIDLPDRLR